VTDGWDDLFDSARRHAEEGGTQAPPDWGEQLETSEESGVRLRWRGETVDENRLDKNDNPRRVFLFWTLDGERVYAPDWYRLVQEIDRLTKEGLQVGDEIALWRGLDYETKSGNSGYTIGLDRKPCPDPLPEEPGELAAAAPAEDDPFAGDDPLF
jgi:hypothetical protein